MRRSYQYRLYPNQSQTKTLEWTLDRCRELYNAALEERREAYRMCGTSLGYYAQKRELPGVKEACPEYKRIGSQVLQDVVRRLDRAFAAFFRRVRAGEKPGYPRFKGKYRYTSFTLAQTGWKLAARESGRLYVAGIGHLKMKWSRPIAGTIKTVAIKRDADQWFVTFSCEVAVEPPPAPDRPAVGIDLGLEYFATLSDGTHIANPRHYRKAQGRIAACDRGMRSKTKRSATSAGKNRAKAAISLRKAHRKVANQRKDMQHKAARQIVRTYGAIAVEDLPIDRMSKRPTPVQNVDGTYAPNGAAAKGGLNKSIHDAGWGRFISILAHKAEEAGVALVKVNPAGTSQVCSGCGVSVPKALDERWHTCASCGLSIQRDVNAARNILIRAGLVRSAA